MYRTLKIKTKNKTQITTHRTTLISLADRTLDGLRISCVFPKYVNHRTTHVFVSESYVVQFANYSRFPEYANHGTTHVFVSGPYVVQIANKSRFKICQPSCSNFQWLKNNKTSRAHVSSIVPPRVREFFFPDSWIVSSYHLQRGLFFTLRFNEPTKLSPRTKRKSTSCHTSLIRMTRKPHQVHNIHAYQCTSEFQRTGRQVHWSPV